MDETHNCSLQRNEEAIKIRNSKATVVQSDFNQQSRQNRNNFDFFCYCKSFSQAKMILQKVDIFDLVSTALVNKWTVINFFMLVIHTFK